MNWTFTQFG